MKIALFVLSGIVGLVGVIYATYPTSPVHQVAAFILFNIAATLLCGGAVVGAIQRKP